MSGIKRQIQAEILADGKHTVEEVRQAFSPEGMRSESGRSLYTPASVSPDKDSYVGKNAIAK